jgi:hypothetical protein
MAILAPIRSLASQGSRSPKWAALRDSFLKGKRCECCLRKSNLNAHHIRPFHLFPSLELEASNLLVLCEGGPWNCHFLCGHAARSWDWYHPDPRAAIDETKRFLKLMKLAAIQ